MRSKTYLNHYLQPPPKDDWYRVKPGAGAHVAITTPVDEMYIAGELHDISVLDPMEIIMRFEEYEDVDSEEEWIL
jgi:hypothetical protein